jgi:hypothetical protein
MRHTSSLALSLLPVLFAAVASGASGCAAGRSESDGTGASAESIGGQPLTGIGGKCLDVYGSNSSNGAAVGIWTCNGGDNQSWTYTAEDTLVGLDGKCLDVAGAGTRDGNRVQLYACNGTVAQVWVWNNGALVNPHSGKCLDVTGDVDTDGALVQIWDCWGGSNQKWAFPTTTKPAPDSGAPPTTPDAGGGGEGGGGGSSTGVQAHSANAFLASMGVNIHDDQDNDDDYAAQFTYTGLRNARAAQNRSAAQLALHQATISAAYPGVMFSVLFYGGTSISAAISDAVLLRKGGALLAIEGPNEPNNQPFSYGGAEGGSSGSWVPVADFQRDVYAAVKGNATLASTPVYTISEPGAETDDVGLQYLVIPAGAGTSLPAGTQFADFANCHNYVAPGDNNAWNNASPNASGPGDGMYGEYVGQTWNKHFAAAATTATVPHVTTETGWTTSTSDNPGATTELAQALDILDIYLAQFTRGFDKTFIYEMFDDDGGNAGFGIYDASHNPKTAATYIHNLTTILADTADGAPGKLPYSIANEPATAHDLLLEKSDGTFYLVVWNERITGSDALTVSLGGSHEVTVYDPTRGTAAVQTLGTVSSVPLTADNRPYILAIK